MKFSHAFLACSLSLVFLAPSMKAGSVTDPFSGTFTYDNDVVLFQVDLPIDETLVVYSTSAATGGFAPYLVLWGGDGTQIAQFNGGEPTCSNGYSTPRPDLGCNDTYVEADNLIAGTYYVGLSQTNNSATGNFGDPFKRDGVENRNYTNLPPYSGCAPNPGYFCEGLTGTSDTPNWTINFQVSRDDQALETVTQLGVDAAPEPASVLSFVGGLGLLGAMLRKRR